ncbi:hypothetical protein ECANGB1_1244 [Enterospora canceri]|uniref:Uncharacterized protein n=1 Tax=Enterospora canceri TaxID=1081671 RepID=A0A1Y1S6G3_9MICR|nr:hypothetical protein ECANGB1_1244 [Enterospora canceri]
MELEFAEHEDTTAHSDALDGDFKCIYDDPMNSINVLDELNQIGQDKSINMAKEEQIIDKGYFAKRHERSEVFMRYEQAERLKNVFNIKEFLEESFNTVLEEDDDVVESYPLVASDMDSFVMIAGENVNFTSYESTSGTSVVNRISVAGRPYNLTMQNVDKYICINIKNGQAYYSTMNSIHKLSKP